MTHALGHGRERLERTAVERELAAAVAESDTGDGFLASTCGLDEGLGHQRSTFRMSSSKGFGCWA